MATFTVQQGKRYRASISLGLFERWTSNETITGMLTDAGFSEVRVWGSGGTREAEGLWPKPTVTAEMPSQIQGVAEVKVA